MLQRNATMYVPSIAIRLSHIHSCARTVWNRSIARTRDKRMSPAGLPMSNSCGSMNWSSCRGQEPVRSHRRKCPDACAGDRLRSNSMPRQGSSRALLQIAARPVFERRHVSIFRQTCKRASYYQSCSRKCDTFPTAERGVRDCSTRRSACWNVWKRQLSPTSGTSISQYPQEREL